MKKLMTSLFVGVLALGLLAGGVSAEVNAVTPSTNDINRTNGWAHVDQLSQGVGTTDLQFISTRNFYSCFEYRVDNEPNTVPGPNPNPLISDGRWTQVCVKNSSVTKVIAASEFVEVRMVYGAETDERFDWTRFEVIPAPTFPVSKEECKKDGWMNFSNPVFKNQGECVSFVANHKTLFVASDSLYYNGPTDAAPLYGTGAIAFTWDPTTGVVTDGYYKEIVPPTTGTLYYNVVTDGSVIGGVVHLHFVRGSYEFDFNGTLSEGVLTGTLAGPYYFTATSD